MSGAHGNDNLFYATATQYLTVDGTSDNVTVGVGTKAVSLFATAACWVKIGTPGETPVAAAPGAEKTRSQRTIYLPAETSKDIPIPVGAADAPVKIAAIQATATGTLYIEERNDF